MRSTIRIYPHSYTRRSNGSRYVLNVNVRARINMYIFRTTVRSSYTQMECTTVIKCVTTFGVRGGGRVVPTVLYGERYRRVRTDPVDSKKTKKIAYRYRRSCGRRPPPPPALFFSTATRTRRERKSVRIAHEAVVTLDVPEYLTVIIYCKARASHTHCLSLSRASCQSTPSWPCLL